MTGETAAQRAHTRTIAPGAVGESEVKSITIHTSESVDVTKQVPLELLRGAAETISDRGGGVSQLFSLLLSCASVRVT